MPGIAYDRAAAVFDATRGFPPGVAERFRAAVLRAAGDAKHARFLELGVGTGRIALPFFAAGDAYTGVDLSLPMLAQAARKLADAAAPHRAHLIQGDVCRLPCADGAFDLVLAVNVLHLVDDWRAALAEARRMLRRPGGRLLIARDRRRDVAAAGDTPAQLVERQWAQILADLGRPRSPHPPSVWGRLDAAAEAALRQMGASVERPAPLEYALPGRTARDVAAEIAARAYPDDWALPDTLHAAAVRRLEHWLATACPDPARRLPRAGRVDFLLATWPAST